VRGRIERMRTATISEAKQRLEELIAAARAGEDVEITQDGRRVAAITAEVNWDERLERNRSWKDEMVARGLLIRAVLPPDPSAIDPLPTGYSGVLDALLDERAEGR
jgi:prevent-host-death family protein